MSTAAPGPVRAIRFIHTAIDAECATIEELARTASGLDELGQRLDFFGRILTLHNQGEEEGTFPEVAAKAGEVIPPYLHDHRIEEQHRSALVDAVARRAQPEALRAAIALREHLALHIQKENELLVPLVERLFTTAEQTVLVGKMMSVFGPADLAAAIPWIVRSVPPADRIAYLSMMKSVMPPERFAAVSVWVRGGVPHEMWIELVAALPALAS